MKKYLLLSFILGLLSFPLMAEVADIVNDKYNNEITDKIYMFTLAPSYGMLDAFAGNCTNDVAENGFGWVFRLRKYYKCGTVNIALSDVIYGEYKRPRDLKREALADSKEQTLK